ncbi:MAG: aminomethyl-transferring glycine dehydrogenase subunit GcvPB [SAR324 cluster bacterium]|nr:aminomethyl-transferring glycine dehydrogenase subunit GcvPB [SAR324 cluster bacterium]
MKTPVGYFHETPLSFDYQATDGDGVKLRELDVPDVNLASIMPGVALRQDNLDGIPQLSEFETVRHFTRLSKKNLSIDAAMYPLGSCTMKYNPRINEVIARYPGFNRTHPEMPDKLVQGNLEMLYLLEKYLLEITGFHSVTLQSVAGAQGELVGIMLIRAHLEAQGNPRKYILIPDSAHGTNPSSAALAGYETRQIKSLPNGLVDLEALEQAMDEEVAGLMLTNPNTLGVFERDILKVAEIVHKKGGFVYCDGANMNAQVGIARPGDYGMDVLHLNLHKTFATPHGGGGPGAGPCFCTSTLAPYLPVPRVGLHANGGYFLDWDCPQSIGKVSTFYGNFGILLRALTYIVALGSDGLKQMSEVAVLNANYLKHQLKDILSLASHEASLHEVVFSDKGLDKHGGIAMLDLAKRLIDYGFHPPTVYFPLIVKGALMIEPTESEPKDELDRFVDAIKQILQEADENPELVKTAPHLTPRRRLDESLAARKPVLRWTPSSQKPE